MGAFFDNVVSCIKKVELQVARVSGGCEELRGKWFGASWVFGSGIFGKKIGIGFYNGEIGVTLRKWGFTVGKWCRQLGVYGGEMVRMIGS